MQQENISNGLHSGPELFGDLSESVSEVIANLANSFEIQQDAIRELASDVIFRMTQLTQDSIKFMEQGRRRKLLVSDVDNSMRLRNIEPHFGFSSSYLALPLRLTSGGGRDLSLPGNSSDLVDITELTATPLGKAAVEPSYRAHWLAIEGMQPAVAENPPPYSRIDQREDSVDPAKKLIPTKEAPKPTSVAHINKSLKALDTESELYRQLATYEPSVEQQLYYKEIIEACVGSDETRRTEALSSLSADPGLHDIVPRLTTFIAEGVRVNVVQRNIALLIYLMRMVKALLDNQSLNLEKYLHDLIPSVGTCIVSKQLSSRPEFDNHWALRDFGARLMAQICRNFNTSTNNIQTRITRIFSTALLDDENLSLASVYGAFAGLGELGPEVISSFILPKLKYIGKRITVSSGAEKPMAERKAAAQVKELVVKYAVPVLKETWNPNETMDRAQELYGDLAHLIVMAVAQARAQESRKNSTDHSSGRTYSNSGSFDSPRHLATSQDSLGLSQDRT